jgi:hypothetical protein
MRRVLSLQEGRHEVVLGWVRMLRLGANAVGWCSCRRGRHEK